MTAIDRRFFREAYNAQLILTELSEAIPTLSKTKQLVELVADQISHALHPENVTIFLDDELAGAYVAAVSSEASKAGAGWTSRPRSLVLRYDERPINHLRKSKLWHSVEFAEAHFMSPGPPSAGDTVPYHHESTTLREIRSKLLIPIASNGHLYGLISLGRRLSDLPYSKEDQGLLFVVANQIAAFIENMKLSAAWPRGAHCARVRVAGEVQRHLFPADGLEDDALEIYGTCLPARGVVVTTTIIWR